MGWVIGSEGLDGARATIFILRPQYLVVFSGGLCAMTMSRTSSFTNLALEIGGDARAWAAFSSWRRYRYALGRIWSASAATGTVGLFVLHNRASA